MHIFYDLPDNVTAFTAGKGCHGTEPGVDAREVGVTFPSLEGETPPFPLIGRVGEGTLFIPRQTHSLNVCWTDKPGECPDTDAVITSKRGLCVAVKTADCIPVLLYDERQQLVAAVHAGWRGTVGRIVSRTIKEMNSRGEDLHAIIGPGISLDAFEVGDEVYDAFRENGFPMERMARSYPTAMCSPSGKSEEGCKWHIDLWEANRWLLEEAGVRCICVSGVCTHTHCDQFYSARRESIRTGRNINGIMMN